MNFLGFLLIGLLAGGIAGRIAEGHGFGCIGNIVVGIIGALLGGWLFTLLNIPQPGGAFIGSLITSTVGAIVFLVVLRLLKK